VPYKPCLSVQFIELLASGVGGGSLRINFQKGNSAPTLKKAIRPEFKTNVAPLTLSIVERDGCGGEGGGAIHFLHQLSP